MARSAASRRRYRDEPPRKGAAGSAFVLTMGILLIVAALAGGYVLKWKSGLVSVDDEPRTADVAQVCAAVNEHNAKYRKQITDTLQVGVQAVLDGDEAAAKKVETDIAAMAKEWAAKLRGESARTDNAELRDAIGGLATKLQPVESGEASLNDMNRIVDESTAAIGQHCPGGAATSGPAAGPTT